MTEGIEKVMSDRENKIKKIRDKSNRVEDEIFSDFCEEIGVDNIRSESL